MSEQTMDRAQHELDSRALIAVVVSRFPLSALGPWINLVSGATRVGWQRFSLGVLIGDGIWILAYVGGGYVFADNVSHLSAKMTSVLAAVAFLGLATLIGRRRERLDHLDPARPLVALLPDMAVSAHVPKSGELVARPFDRAGPFRAVSIDPPDSCCQMERNSPVRRPYWLTSRGAT